MIQFNDHDFFTQFKYWASQQLNTWKTLCVKVNKGPFHFFSPSQSSLGSAGSRVDQLLLRVSQGLAGGRGHWRAPAGLLGHARRDVRGRVGVGARVAGAPLHCPRPALTLTRITARTLRWGAAVFDSVSRASPRLLLLKVTWKGHHYLFLIQSSWQSWCWGRTSWNDTEAGSTDFSHSLSRAWRAVNLLEGSRASIPSSSSRAEIGMRGLNSSLTRLLYCFLGLSCWNPGRLITWGQKISIMKILKNYHDILPPATQLDKVCRTFCWSQGAERTPRLPGTEASWWTARPGCSRSSTRRWRVRTSPPPAEAQGVWSNQPLYERKIKKDL